MSTHAPLLHGPVDGLYQASCTAPTCTYLTTPGDKEHVCTVFDVHAAQAYRDSPMARAAEHHRDECLDNHNEVDCAAIQYAQAFDALCESLGLDPNVTQSIIDMGQDVGQHLRDAREGRR